MNGLVTRSNDTVVPTVAANAMSSTTTRPVTLSALGSMRGDANASCGRCTGPSIRSLHAVHGDAPAVVQVDLPHGAAIAALRSPRAEQAQRALAAVGDQRAAPAGGDLPDQTAVDPHVDRLGARRVVDEERRARPGARRRLRRH